MRFIAPVLLAIAAVAGAFISTIVIGGALSLSPVTDWLMLHDTVGMLFALVQFAAYALVSGLAVAVVTQFVLKRPRFTLPWAGEHIVHSSILYGCLLMAAYGKVSCGDNCDGVVLGTIKFWGLLALGGIVANAWVVRRTQAWPRDATRPTASAASRGRC